jgi:oligoribonuclease NrnB/cAMP/cGMP phosphodiesterase (DHH superfamily)
MSKIFIIYHGNCFDGFGAAYSAWRHFKNIKVNPLFIPAIHGEPFPIPQSELAEAEVYIADFAYPKSVMIQIHSLAKKLVILDHHKTAEAVLKDLDFAHFDMSRSGAMMTWDYFHSKKKAPKLIQYIQDKDLWKFQLPHSKEINAVIQTYPVGSEKDFLKYDQLSDRLENSEEFNSLILEGKAILRSQEQWVETAIRRSVHRIKLGEYEIPAVNTSVLESEICHKLLELHPKDPFVATYYETQAPEFENFSLRSRGNFDVSEIAKRYGGGGHLAAAGFRKTRKSKP